jgi:hypothetical protein
MLVVSKKPRCIVLAKCFYSRATYAVCLNLSFLGNFVKYILQKLKDEINKINIELLMIVIFCIDIMPLCSPLYVMVIMF